MTGYEFGDLVLVPFPFTDQSTTKRRPAAVVSSAAYHRERRDLIILAVTSQAHPSVGVGEVSVARWKEAGLLEPSALKPVLATIERRLVLRKLGRLASEDRLALSEVRFREGPFCGHLDRGLGRSTLTLVVGWNLGSNPEPRAILGGISGRRRAESSRTAAREPPGNNGERLVYLREGTFQGSIDDRHP